LRAEFRVEERTLGDLLLPLRSRRKCNSLTQYKIGRLEKEEGGNGPSFSTLLAVHLSRELRVEKKIFGKPSISDGGLQSHHHSVPISLDFFASWHPSRYRPFVHNVEVTITHQIKSRYATLTISYNPINGATSLNLKLPISINTTPDSRSSIRGIISLHSECKVPR
jgi:hypothetical protein